MKIERFEDIEAWQPARELTRKVYRLTKKPEFARNYGLKRQIQDAAGSSMHNIAEGFDSDISRNMRNAGRPTVNRELDNLSSYRIRILKGTCLFYSAIMALIMSEAFWAWSAISPMRSTVLTR